MTATCATVAYLGLEARAVEVQVQLIAGLPAFNVVGLADKAVAESRERVRGAIAALGLALPPKRIVVNLSPADLPKEGAHFDLPIACALLAAMGVIDGEALADFVVVGELALDARIQPSPGVLLAALHAGGEGKGLICPAAQGPEAAWAGSIEVVAAPDLLALVNHLKGHGLLAMPTPGEVEESGGGPDLRQVKGQEVAKRALEIAAAGGHNLLGSCQATHRQFARRLPLMRLGDPQARCRHASAAHNGFWFCCGPALSRRCGWIAATPLGNGCGSKQPSIQARRRDLQQSAEMGEVSACRLSPLVNRHPTGRNRARARSSGSGLERRSRP